MTTTETVMKLMDYFASSYPRRSYAPRDFDARVMPSQDLALAGALEELVADGVLESSAALDFRLTDAGLELVRQLRHARALRDPNLVPA